MTSVITAALDRAIESLPGTCPGPGGAVAVVKDGVPIIRHGWGFANLEAREPFTPHTLAPICSITKQFTCATMLSVTPDVAALDPLTAAWLPRLEGEKPSTLDLANNQSGLRDYWALTVLCGALPEGDFRPADAARLIGLTRSLHFRPGTAYSYSNGNFRVLSLALEQQTGRDFADLLMERVVRPAGMETAVFTPETSATPGGAIGYEGTLDTGWRAGINKIHWSGDAGLCASVDDMIAWERLIDRTRDDPGSLYARLSRPPSFRDGTPAEYGLGLSHRTRWGRAMTGHGGAIRGWRVQRLWVPSERLSICLALNHESDARSAVMEVLAAALGESDPSTTADAVAAQAFAGTWLDEIGLVLSVAVNSDSTLSASYAGGAEVLEVGPDGVARGTDMTLSLAGPRLRIMRPGDVIDSLAERVDPDAPDDIAGRYISYELEAELQIVNAGGSWFAGFSGFLGTGPMMPLLPTGRDVWRMACHRSLDAPAPGDWTFRIERGPDSKVSNIAVGCWLARNVTFSR